MNKHPFHIRYNTKLPESVMSAIDNVFDNFYYFLNFNSFIVDSNSFSIGKDEMADFQLSERFIDNLEKQDFHHMKWFSHKPLIEEKGNKDYLGTCFFMINCLQEYANDQLDELGRFPFEQTYQSKFSCAEEHLVLQYFQEIALVIFRQNIPLNSSQFMLSHDIDFLNSGWKSQVKKSLVKSKFLTALAIGFNRLKGKDPQQNIEQILSIEKQYNIPSIFFFLTKRGKTGVKGVRNSDYAFSSPYVQECIAKIKQSPLHHLGLHKSISTSSINEENRLMSAIHHRFHYLAFSLPQSFEELSQNDIQFDYSLGFSEKIGFRNSYGLPFQPYNPRTNRYYDFWEFPITIMDSSLHYYMQKSSSEEKLSYIEAFLQKNAASCLISLLWHNDFFEVESYTKLLERLQKDLSPFPIK